jgi:ABC-type branched-subunit amino acid transport system substrate-binding protein
MSIRQLTVGACVALCLATFGSNAIAQKKYDPGASDTEIKIGQTMPYSGPASAYGAYGTVIAAYFHKINDEGGINGRKINFISLDDAYSPPKTVEMTRRLVEQDQVLFTFASLGTPQNTAVHAYMNSRKVPQLFVFTGATKWNDPQNHPWTMGLTISYQTEARIYAKHILQTRPGAKIAVLYQNDDFGKDYLKGLKDGLGEQAGRMIVAEATYEVTDPTADSQVVQLQGSGADVLFSITAPKTSSQVIRKLSDIGWKPTQYLTAVSNSVGAVLKPAGFERATGVISGLTFKDPNDPRWDNDPGMVEWRAFMTKYDAQGSLADSFNVGGYNAAVLLVHVLRACGDNLTHENVMRQAASLKDFRAPLSIPGIALNTSPTDFAPTKSMQLVRFDGRSWVPIGDVMGL